MVSFFSTIAASLEGPMWRTFRWKKGRRCYVKLWHYTMAQTAKIPNCWPSWKKKQRRHNKTADISVKRIKNEFGNGSVRVLEVGMNKKWKIILRWPPLYSVGGWEESYAVLVQEFRPTGEPVGRQFMHSKHRPEKNIRTIITGSAQNGRIPTHRANSGGGVCPSEFPNQ